VHPSVPLNLDSANGERRVESSRREGGRLPAALRYVRTPAARVPAALLDADSFEDLPGKWQAAILKAEENRPNLRVVDGDQLELESS
jgi:hypothetical protein